MRVIGRMLVIVAGVAAIGVTAASAQDTDRRELERRLEELRTQVRDLERQLGVGPLPGNPGWTLPRVLSLATNRAQLGVYVQLEANDETDAIGAVLSGVSPGGPAAAAGLREGDIIVRFDGESLAGRYPAAGRDESEPGKKLVDLVGDLDPGDEVAIEYRRGDRTFTTTATLESRDNEFAFRFLNPDSRTIVGSPRISTNVRPRVEVRSFGPRGDVFALLHGGLWGDMELVTLNEGLARYFGTDEGLLVVRGPANSSIGLQSGDVILSIDGREPRTPSRAIRILESYESGETASIQIVRDRNRMTVDVTIPEPNDGWRRHEQTW